MIDPPKRHFHPIRVDCRIASSRRPAVQSARVAQKRPLVDRGGGR
jgi:hypothetical protein